MTGLWVVTGAALAVALWAWLTARRAVKRLAQLSEMYWELKYQQVELRNQLQRMPGANTPETAAPAAPTPTRPPDGFVPLKSLRR